MTFGEVAKYVGVLGLRDVLLFPLWWYTKGIVYTTQKLWYSARKQAARVAVGLWVKNLFVPMYGQYDWQGRVISFFVRLFQIIGRSLAYVAWVGVLVFLGMFYLCAPLLLMVFFVLHADLSV